MHRGHVYCENCFSHLHIKRYKLRLTETTTYNYNQNQITEKMKIKTYTRQIMREEGFNDDVANLWASGVLVVSDITKSSSNKTQFQKKHKSTAAAAAAA